MSADQHSLEAEKAPVFIVGCARSGTTLMYHTLLSSGRFATYLAEPAVFDLLVPKFGDLSVLKNRKILMNCWLKSKMFRASGLNREQIEAKILSECTSNGDFLTMVMGETARAQGVDRWAVWGPDNLLYIPQIKKELPRALFIHMIRDGRDVALSLHKEKWIRPLPWDKRQALLVAALHWLWKVNRGRRHGQLFQPDYLEVRFEDLVTEPRTTLSRISHFIGDDLDYERIQGNAVGTLRASNSSFRTSTREWESNPIGRWRELFSQTDISLLESVLGPTLLDFGYSVSQSELRSDLKTELRKIIYSAFSEAKLWCKAKTPLGRLSNIDRLRLEPSVR
jgi:hypothetical protein